MTNEQFFSVAIDGPSGAGKSTLAKSAAAKFGFVYVDTGAIYRTVGLSCNRRRVDLKNEDKVKAVLPTLSIDIRYDGTGLQHMFLNGEDVSEAIRMPEISMAASAVSAMPSVRLFLLEKQRDFARRYNVIMDGRDIGTVVLPDARLKIYLTASTDARAKRRFRELCQKNVATTLEEVAADIEQRDYQDTHRDIAPLRKASDALELDTSDMTLEESFNALCDLIQTGLEMDKAE